MSEEEKKAIEFLKGVCTDDCVNRYFVVDTILNYIDRLQKELEQEKEKNKELKEGLNFRVNYCKKLEQELYGGEFEETVVEQKYFVSKDKIKDKIKYWKEAEKLGTRNDKEYYRAMCQYRYGTLEELLEEN